MRKSIYVKMKYSCENFTFEKGALTNEHVKIKESCEKLKHENE